jgi:hypothetical protein
LCFPIITFRLVSPNKWKIFGPYLPAAQSKSCYTTAIMRKLLLALAFAYLASAADGSRIRAVTAVTEVDPAKPTASIEDAQKFLASAKEALNKAGFEET